MSEPTISLRSISNRSRFPRGGGGKILLLPAERDALVEAVAASQTFADNWRGVPVGPDTFGRTLAVLRGALARFTEGET